MTDRNLFLRAAEGDEEAEREVLARLRRKHPPRYAELAREAIPLAMEECARCYIAGEIASAPLNQDEIEFELVDGGWTKRVRLSYYVTENDRGQILRKLGVDAPPSIRIKV